MKESASAVAVLLPEARQGESAGEMRVSLEAPRSAIRDFAHVQNGWGKCSKNGCNCNTFEGYGGTCANSGCGHSFEDHW